MAKDTLSEKAAVSRPVCLPADTTIMSAIDAPSQANRAAGTMTTTRRAR